MTPGLKPFTHLQFDSELGKILESGSPLFINKPKPKSKAILGLLYSDSFSVLTAMKGVESPLPGLSPSGENRGRIETFTTGNWAKKMNGPGRDTVR